MSVIRASKMVVLAATVSSRHPAGKISCCRTQNTCVAGRTTRRGNCGIILGLHRAVATCITGISIGGGSRLATDQINSCAHCTTRDLSALLDRTLRLLQPRFPPHIIDVQWVQRNFNQEAHAGTNAGVCVGVPERRILFYDD